MSSLRTFLDNLTAAQLAERLNLAVEGAHLGIWDWDLRDNAVQFDRRWCAMLGIDHATMPMELSSWESRVHPDDIAQCYADIQAYLRGDTAFYENIHRMKHADGRWVYILDRGRVSGWDDDGKAIRFTGTHFDCTATEEAKRVLEGEQRMLKGLVRGVPAAVALIDPAGRVIAASDEWQAWFDALDGDGMRGPFNAPAPPSWRESFQQTLDGAEPEHTEERIPSGQAGEGRVVRWSMRQFGHGDGLVRGVFVRFDDITEETRRAQAAQTARLLAMGQIAGGVAHELNTPLQTLLMDATVMAEELDEADPDPDLLRELTAQIGATTRFLAEVVDGMRTLSRDADGDPLTAVSVARAISQVRHMSAARLASNGTQVTVRKADPAWTVQARASHLAQILINLVTNAADAVAGQPDGWIRLGATRTDQGLEISVTDSGPGVPADLRDAIMAPFFTTKAPGAGTGLGLSLSQSLAEGMGAQLRLDPTRPHTTFRLTFPASP